MDETAAQAKHATELARLHPMKQEIYLSLRGAEAWRLHRTGGLNRSLVLEMFATVDHYNQFRLGVYDVLDRFTHNPDYDTAGMGLLHHYDATRAEFAATNPAKFEAFKDRTMFMVEEKIRNLRIDPDDPRTRMVDWTGSLAITEMYITSNEHEFTDRILAIWFQVCDLALGGTLNV